MSGTTSIPAIQFTPVGIVLPTEAQILAGAQADINAAFGGNLNQALETPQGQLASSWSADIASANDIFAKFCALIDPATSSGFMQDAICRIYFLSRDPALPTVVSVLCTGAVDTPIPTGALVKDTGGNIYSCTGGGTIPSGGSITLQFACTKTGPIAVIANSISIYQAISGWDSATNPADGVTGRDVESPQDFEYRRQQSVAINAKGTPDAIYGAMFALPGVLDCFVIDNPLNTTVDYGSTNYPLAPHSVCVSIAGGAAADIGETMRKKKDLGCDTVGNTAVTVTDPAYSVPQPTYTYNYLIPANTPVYVAVTLQNNANLPSDITPLVKAAIASAFTGADGGQRARIAGTILGSRFYPAVTATSAYAAIISIYVDIAPSPSVTFVELGIDHLPTLDPANITVAFV